jgi:hypothetical protein
MAYEQDRIPGNHPYHSATQPHDPAHRLPPPGSGVGPVAGIIAIIAIVALVLFAVFGRGGDGTVAPEAAPVEAPLAPEAGAPATDLPAPAAPPAATEDTAPVAPAPAD